MKREESLRTRDQALGEIQLLDPEVYQSRKRELKRLKQALKVDRQSAEIIRVEVERGRQLAQCLEKQLKLRELGVVLESDYRRQHADFEKLKLHRKAEVFLPALAKVEQRKQTLADAEQASEIASNAALEARANLRLVLEAARRQAERAEASAKTDAKKLRSNVEHSEAEGEAIAHWLAAHKGDAELSTALPSIASGLTRIAGLRAMLATLEKRKSECADEVSTVTGELNALREERTKVEKKIGNLKEAISVQNRQIEDLLAGRELAQMQESYERYRVQQGVQVRASKLKVRETELVTVIARLRQEHESVGKLLIAQKQVVEALRESLQAARLVASLEEHRRDLEPGEACPLCEALEHPYVATENRPHERAEQLQQACGKLQSIEESERDLAGELAKTDETLRVVREEQIEGAKLLEGAPAEIDERITALKTQIAKIREVEQLVVAAEKDAIERQGEFEKITERITGLGQRLERLEVERDRIAKETEAEC